MISRLTVRVLCNFSAEVSILNLLTTLATLLATSTATIIITVVAPRDIREKREEYQIINHHYYESPKISLNDILGKHVISNIIFRLEREGVP